MPDIHSSTLRASPAATGPESESLSRRSFLQNTALTLGTAGLFAFVTAGCERQTAPAAGQPANASPSALSAAEKHTLEALGEILLPGSAAAGLSDYIDRQLSGPPEACMLIARYLGVTQPFTSFYRTGLAACENASQKAYGKALSELDATSATEMASAMSRGEIAEWSGPAAALFFFILRSDAVDATFGTQAGFERLGVPYMAHIAPPSRWGE